MLNYSNNKYGRYIPLYAAVVYIELTGLPHAQLLPIFQNQFIYKGSEDWKLGANFGFVLEKGIL